MRILLIDKSDSELIEQALKQERIPLDRMQPSESDDSIVIPEDIYDAAILTASDIAYSRGRPHLRADYRAARGERGRSASRHPAAPVCARPREPVERGRGLRALRPVCRRGASRRAPCAGPPHTDPAQRDPDGR